MGTTKKRHLLSVIQKVLITCVMLVVISPFYISIVYALKNKNDLTINRLAWPTHPTLMNFQRVITENDQFLTGYKNSILTTVPVVVLLMLITSMAAYVLARYTTRVYKWIYLIFISGMLIPIQCIMLPFYINFFKLNLTNSNLGFVIARTGLQIPISILVVILLRKPFARTLILAQMAYFNEYTSDLNLAFAFFILATLPILIVYFSMQKYVVGGIMMGAVKG